MQTDVCTPKSAEATTRFLISISVPAGNPVIGQNRVVGGGQGRSPQIQGLWHLRPPMRCEQDSSRTPLNALPAQTSASLLKPWRRGLPVQGTVLHSLPLEERVWDFPQPSGIHMEAHLQLLCLPCTHGLALGSPGPPWDAVVTLHLVTRGCWDLTATLL